VLFSDAAGKLRVAFQNTKGDYDLEVKDFVGTVALSKEEAPYCMDPDSDSKLSTPHSSTYIDLDGDCMPDLFLTRQKGTEFSFEIYISKRHEKQQRYCLVQKGALKAESITGAPPLIDFADIDRDAMFDMIFYLDKKIYTLYNKMSAQSAGNTDLCRRAASEESLKEDYRIFDDIPMNDQTAYDEEYATIQNLDLKEDFNMLQPSAPNIPGRLRLGDVDADGYPDIIITISKKNTIVIDGGKIRPIPESSTAAITSYTYVLKNEKCGSKCSSGADKHRRRYFDDKESDFLNIKKLVGTSVVAGTFMDIDEDGRLDIIVQSREKVNGKHTNVVKVIYNNYVRDTFFIKALMLNSYKRYGDVVVGPSFRAIITDLNDQKKVVIGSQLTQSSYHSLQLPYAYIGVGRSNNYVEQFTAGYAVKGSRAIRPWSPIIPNSQLIV
jgi:integrin alpha FG-GAP repeat containing protein 1